MASALVEKTKTLDLGLASHHDRRAISLTDMIF